MQELVNQLRKTGIDFDDGLKPSEVAQLEAHYNFSFPPDLREFLSVGLPVSPNFPNWRTGQVQRSAGLIPIEEVLDWPASGMSFDIQNGDFWMRALGSKPSDLQDAVRQARKEISLAPALIPVFSHRFLPSEPALAGNPVLSVWQTDIIYYATELTAYFAREFALPPTIAANGSARPRRIRFWSDIIEQGDAEAGTAGGGT